MWPGLVSRQARVSSTCLWLWLSAWSFQRASPFPCSPCIKYGPPPSPPWGRTCPNLVLCWLLLPPPPPISEGHSGCPQQRDPTFPTPIDRAQRVAS